MESESDTVDGMRLPKGSQVFVNVFGLHHDEKRRQDPDVFDPDHHAGDAALASELANGDWEKRDHYSYGTGRRLCPGFHLAERSRFVAMAKLLWAMNMEPGRDAEGEIINPDVTNEDACSAGFVVCAEPLPCKITTRSATRQATIMAEFNKATAEVFTRFEEPKPELS